MMNATIAQRKEKNVGNLFASKKEKLAFDPPRFQMTCQILPFPQLRAAETTTSTQEFGKVSPIIVQSNCPYSKMATPGSARSRFTFFRGVTRPASSLYSKWSALNWILWTEFRTCLIPKAEESPVLIKSWMERFTFAPLQSDSFLENTDHMEKVFTTLASDLQVHQRPICFERKHPRRQFLLRVKWLGKIFKVLIYFAPFLYNFLCSDFEPKPINNHGSGGARSGGKPNSGDGKVIRIINADEQHIKERVLLNLKTTQPFEEVLKDLGQVLKIRKARMMCTKDGLEVRGFNHLRGVFANETSFLISAFRNKVTYEGSEEESDEIAPTRPDLPRGPSRRNSDPIMARRKSARVPSRAQSDKGKFWYYYEWVLWSGSIKIIFKGHVSPPADELGNSDPIKVTIKGERKIFFPPSEGYRRILARPKNELVLDWVYGCRGSDVNKNLWILKTGELVYFVSTFVVIYNRYKETQRHYR